MASNTKPTYERATTAPSGAVHADRLIEAAERSFQQTKMIMWNGIHIRVRTLIGISEYIDVVHHILSDCTTEDGDILVELLDCAIRANIIAAYAFVELPDKYESLYPFIYSSGLYEEVCKAANDAQIKSIIQSVRDYLKI